MNKVILMGRLTRDPELKQTNSQISVTNFSLAVDRRFKTQNGERETDFFDCVAWRGTAEFVAKYFSKGSRILVSGTLQSRTWEDQNGQNRKQVEVVVDETEFADSKPANTQSQSNTAAPVQPQSNNKQAANTAGVFPDMDDDDTALPFDL